MGSYIDSLRLILVGLIISGAISIAVTSTGISAILSTVACVVVFFIWAIYAWRVPSAPGHRWCIALSTPSIPSSSTEDIRKLLRIGTAEELRIFRQPVLEGVDRLERWIWRNLQWSAAVALIVVIDGRWALQHQLAPGSLWSIGTMALGVTV